MAEEVSGVETVSLSELREGSSLFQSRGVSYIKVTHEGKVKRLAIPIKSSGITELVEELNRSAPTPPIINIVVRPDDPAYRELKLTRKQHVKTFDLTDQAYIDARDKFQSDMGIQIILHGIDLPIKDKSGEVVTEGQKKITILKEMGLTGEHFSQLIKDITDLTKWDEVKREDFLED